MNDTVHWSDALTSQWLGMYIITAVIFAFTNVICDWICKNRYKLHIKTHDSESRGQEEAGHTRRMSVLFTGSTGVKFVNALNKPPLKLSLSNQGPSTL